MKGILGRKAGMSQIFLEDGKSWPVTLIEIKPNTIVQIKTKEKDGYDSIKLGYGDKKPEKVNKPTLGRFKKINSKPKYFEREIKNFEHEGLLPGDSLLMNDVVEVGHYVDVTAITKGKGFQGSIKRHGQSRGPMGHGSKFHRKPGSMGDIASVVRPTKKLPGHMGHVQVTQQNSLIARIDLENHVLFIKGSIPGPNGSYVIIKTATRKPNDFVTFKLEDVKLQAIKNELLLEARKVEADINSEMSIEEMTTIIEKAKVDYEAKQKEKSKLVEEAKKHNISQPDKLTIPELKESIAKSIEIEKKRVAEDKAKQKEEATKKDDKEVVKENKENKKDTNDRKEGGDK